MVAVEKGLDEEYVPTSTGMVMDQAKEDLDWGQLARRLTSVRGVCFDFRYKQWCYKWKSQHRQCKRSFAALKYGFYKSREMALQCKRETEGDESVDCYFTEDSAEHSSNIKKPKLPPRRGAKADKPRSPYNTRRRAHRYDDLIRTPLPPTPAMPAKQRARREAPRMDRQGLMGGLPMYAGLDLYGGMGGALTPGINDPYALGALQPGVGLPDAKMGMLGPGLGAQGEQSLACDLQRALSRGPALAADPLFASHPVTGPALLSPMMVPALASLGNNLLTHAEAPRAPEPGTADRATQAEGPARGALLNSLSTGSDDTLLHTQRSAILIILQDLAQGLSNGAITVQNGDATTPVKGDTIVLTTASTCNSPESATPSVGGSGITPRENMAASPGDHSPAGKVNGEETPKGAPATGTQALEMPAAAGRDSLGKCITGHDTLGKPSMGRDSLEKTASERVSTPGMGTTTCTTAVDSQGEAHDIPKEIPENVGLPVDTPDGLRNEPEVRSTEDTVERTSDEGWTAAVVCARGRDELLGVIRQQQGFVRELRNAYFLSPWLHLFYLLIQRKQRPRQLPAAAVNTLLNGLLGIHNILQHLHHWSS